MTENGATSKSATGTERPSRRRDVRKLIKSCAGIALALCALWFAAKTWSVIRTPVIPSSPALVVNDVTQLNPIQVAEVLTPTTTDEIVEAVRQHSGPISIGGARHSMGGQTATRDALFIDMRQFNRIVDFSPAEKTIAVQAGARWRDVQEYIDPADLSVKIMQSYANFTVGGSLSVNAHGRYVGLGPIISSVKSLKIVLADGSILDASPSSNSDIFYGTIGGYGGLGVIVEATLQLTDNVKVKRHGETMPVSDYKQFFLDKVRDQPSAVFHNAEIYPPDYTTVRAVTSSITDDPLTIQDRLVPADQRYRSEQFGIWVLSEWPFGKSLRQRVYDPAYYEREPVTWRNYEASLDTAELEPASRDASTYAIEEYFVPVERFDDFLPRMRQTLQKHNVNAIYVSLRHAKQDPGSLLAWARTEVFAFVIYYKQGTSDPEKEQVGVWTRELIDAAVDLGGTYYLPYQLHATQQQFQKAYPRSNEYIELKRRLDPTYKFRNEFIDKYLHP